MNVTFVSFFTIYFLNVVVRLAYIPLKSKGIYLIKNFGYGKLNITELKVSCKALDKTIFLGKF